MKKIILKKLGTATALVSLLFMVGCQCPPKKAAASAPRPQQVCPTSKKIMDDSFYYPGTCDTCAILKVNKEYPTNIMVGVPYNYTITVTNLVNVPVTDVIVTEHVPENLKIEKSTPPFSKGKNNAIYWDLGTLDAGEVKEIIVNAVPQNVGEVKYCTTVVANPLLCAKSTIIKPDLKISASSPDEISVCEDFQYKVVVSNTGSGETRDIEVVTDLPAGLTTVDGKRQIVHHIKALCPGESAEFVDTIKPSKTGNFEYTSVANAEGDLSASSKSFTAVLQPELDVEILGPNLVYLNREAEYTINVKNTGNMEAQNTQLVATIPANMKFVSASNGGQPSAGKVTWNLGTLDANKSDTVKATYSATQIGSGSPQVTAKAVCAKDDSDTVTTASKGIPALLMEVIDKDDPVLVGKNMVYKITITNQGSEVANNVRINCELEDNMEFASGSGASSIKESSARSVTFSPLSKLQPGDQAVWTVTIKALKTGDVRFKVSMISDELTRYVEETEATRVYE